jgi:hypothetical protein
MRSRRRRDRCRRGGATLGPARDGRRRPAFQVVERASRRRRSRPATRGSEGARLERRAEHRRGTRVWRDARRTSSTVSRPGFVSARVRGASAVVVTPSFPEGATLTSSAGVDSRGRFPQVGAVRPRRRRSGPSGRCLQASAPHEMVFVLGGAEDRVEVGGPPCLLSARALRAPARARSGRGGSAGLDRSQSAFVTGVRLIRNSSTSTTWRGRSSSYENRLLGAPHANGPAETSTSSSPVCTPATGGGSLGPVQTRSLSRASWIVCSIVSVC